MEPPFASGAYRSGTVDGRSGTGAGRALPDDWTVHVALVSSVTDWRPAAAPPG